MIPEITTIIQYCLGTFGQCSKLEKEIICKFQEKNIYNYLVSKTKENKLKTIK